MLKRFVLTLSVTLASLVAFAAGPDGAFPIKPDTELTPGDYCQRPDSYRYNEKIPYCERNVNTGDKNEIVQMYNSRLGYTIKRQNSNGQPDFKIDHLIPLCAGGSNEIRNLWPQHKSVYQITDPMEGLACEKMAAGRLSQKRAVQLIFMGKMDHSKVDEVIRTLQAL
jgi:hypothetical protein